MLKRRNASALVLGASIVLSASAAHADFIDHFTRIDDIGANKVPHSGESRILVLVVQVEGFPPHDMDALRAFFSDEPGAPGEFRFTDFYERMSLGAYSPKATVVGPILYDTCPLPETYPGYEDCAIPRGLGEDANEILQTLDVGIGIMDDFLMRADEEFGVDFTEYDVNGPGGEPDGWTDGVLLIHNVDFGGYAIPIFALRKPSAPSFDGVKINSIGMADSAEVSVHEFGHLLGWADLYDESNNSKGLMYSHMGSWYYSTPPPAVDAWSRSRIGWSEPVQVEPGDSFAGLRLRPASTSGDAIQLNTGGDEVFIIENRGGVGEDYIDGDIEERGLAIYHVNTRRAPRPNDFGWPLRLGAGCLNCSTWDPFLMNEQADGLFELQKSGYKRDDAGDLFRPGDVFVPDADNTSPLGPNNKALSSNRYNGALTGVSVTNLRIEGDDILVDVAIEADPCALLTCGAGTCEAGRCVEEEVGGNNSTTPANNSTTPVNNETPEPGPGASAGGGEGEGCAVAPSGELSAGAALLLAAVLGVLRRR